MGQTTPLPANRLIRQIQVYARVQWIFAGAMVFTLLLFLLFVYRPQSQQLEELNRQIAAKKLALETDRSQTSRLPRVRGELDVLKQSLAGYKKLPTHAQYGEFSNEINKASQRTRLSKLLEDPSLKPNRLALYTEQPVILTFEASFADLYQFLTQVENMDRLTRLRDVEIKSIDPVRGTVSVKLSVNIYYTEG